MDHFQFGSVFNGLETMNRKQAFSTSLVFEKNGEKWNIWKQKLSLFPLTTDRLVRFPAPLIQ